MLITSLDNKKVKLYSSLRSKSKRDELGLFLVNGLHLVKEALKNNCIVDILILENQEFDINYDNITYVANDIMKKISFLDNPSKIVGVCRKKENSKLVGNKILLLDNIQDPGNLGTIIRSACAFSVDTIVLSTNTVDLYNDKVIQSTQGMIFYMNVIVMDLVDAINCLKNNDYKIIGTNVVNGIFPSKLNVDKYAIIMGNEGHGISENIANMCDINTYIPMNRNCESLNVGVATSIILYELNRGFMNKIVLGKYVDTHGLKGEIRIKSNFKYKDRVFKIGNEIIIDKPYKITGYRVHKDYDMVTLEGINKIEDIINLKKSLVYIDKDLYMNDTDYLDSDLIGFEVKNSFFSDKVINIEYISEKKKLIKTEKRFIPFELVKEINRDKKIIYVEEVNGL